MKKKGNKDQRKVEIQISLMLTNLRGAVEDLKDEILIEIEMN